MRGRPGLAPSSNRAVRVEQAVADLRASDPVQAALIDEIGVDGLGDSREGRPLDATPV